MYEVGLGDSPMRIAGRLTGDRRRYRELLAANPYKPLVHISGEPTFASLGVGEQLNMPASWGIGAADVRPPPGPVTNVKPVTFTGRTTTVFGTPLPTAPPASREALDLSDPLKVEAAWEADYTARWFPRHPGVMPKSNTVTASYPQGRPWLDDAYWNDSQADRVQFLRAHGIDPVSFIQRLRAANVQALKDEWQRMYDAGHQSTLENIESAISSVAKPVVNVAKGIAIPVADLITSPAKAALAIAQGDNVLSTLGNQFKSAVGDVKALAPVAQTIISFVPGVGAGVNAAIAAGTAIAQGASISDALVAATKNALPGGPLAAQAFDAAYQIGKAAATGGNIGEAALNVARNAAMAQGGPIAAQAFDTGLAIVQGQNVQQAIASGAVNLAKSQAGSIIQTVVPAAARALPSMPGLPSLPAIPSSLVTAASQVTDAAKQVVNTANAVNNAINNLPAPVRNIASQLINRPELVNSPIGDVARMLKSDVATAQQAVAFIKQAKPPTAAQVQQAAAHLAQQAGQQIMHALPAAQRPIPVPAQRPIATAVAPATSVAQKILTPALMVAPPIIAVPTPSGIPVHVVVPVVTAPAASATPVAVPVVPASMPAATSSATRPYPPYPRVA